MSFDASSEVHLRSSLSSTPDAISSRLLTMTFTTAAFGRSRSWRFGASSCKAAPRDLPSSNAQHRAPSLLLDTRNPPHLIVLDFFIATGPERPTEVEIAFEARGAGTEVTVVHRPKPSSEALWSDRAPRYAGAWDDVLAALSIAAA